MSELLFQVSEVSLVVPFFEFVVLDLLLDLLRLLISLPLPSSLHELFDLPKDLISLVVLRIVDPLEATSD
jgi:hypothetical protein